MQASSVSDYIKKAVEEVMGTYLAKTPVLKDTKVKRENAELKDISVIIGLASEKLEGVFIVRHVNFLYDIKIIKFFKTIWLKVY